MTQALNALHVAAQTAGLASTTASIAADVATSQTDLEASGRAMHFEAATSVPGPVPPTARPLLPALFAGMAAMLPTAALAQEPEVERLAAAAQVHGSETFANLVQTLPPTWQLVVGGLLYAEPTLRGLNLVGQKLGLLARTNAITSEDPENKRLLNRLNGWSGAYARMIAPIGDWIGTPILTGAFLFSNDQPLWIRLLETAYVLGITIWNRHDRFRRVEGTLDDNQLRAGISLRPDRAGEVQNQALGAMARTVPTAFREEDRITDLPDGRNPQAKPDSWWASLRAVASTLSYTFHLRRTYSRLAGFVSAMKARLMTFKGVHAPIHPPAMRVMDKVLVPQWANDQARIYGNRVEANLAALASIPEGSPVVHVAPVHAMWPDYQFLRVRPQARFAPDEKNFWGNLFAKLSGFSAFLDVTGFGTLKRGSGFFNPRPLVQKMVEAGTEPLFFSPGTRTPRTWTDDGRPDRPGLRGAISDRSKGLKHPERYCNLNGAIKTAVAAAKATGKTAYMPVIMVDGGTEITPKWGRTFPFPQRIFRNKTMTFRVASIVKVDPDANEKQVWNQIVQIAKDDMGIDDHVRNLVESWMPGESADRFAGRAEADERYYTLAERIWCIHPDYNKDGRRMRETFIGRLRSLLETDSPSDEDVMRLLRDASLTAKETEYKAPWKKKA